jgi:hypothetical protein
MARGLRAYPNNPAKRLAKVGDLRAEKECGGGVGAGSDAGAVAASKTRLTCSVATGVACASGVAPVLTGMYPLHCR